FRAGLLVEGTDLAPICIKVEDFRTDYLLNGQAEMFTSNIRFSVEVTTTDPDTWDPYTLQVGADARLGDRVRHGAWAAARGVIVSNSTGVTLPRRSCRLRR